FQAIQAALDAHNMIIRDMLQNFVDFTSQRQRRYGGFDQKNMQELDEFGRARPTKISAGVTAGFPLRKYGDALQWTRIFFQVATTQELAAETDSMMDADARNIQVQIRRGLYSP